MKTLEKISKVLSFIVTGASAIVAISEIVEKFSPELKAIFAKLVEAAKELKDADLKEEEIKEIANKVN